jgi:hypothetical protein
MSKRPTGDRPSPRFTPGYEKRGSQTPQRTPTRPPAPTNLVPLTPPPKKDKG